MITKMEFALLREILNNNGSIAFKKQRIFTNDISFYRAIRNLKKYNFVIKIKYANEDSRIKNYEITFKGIELCKLFDCLPYKYCNV